MKVMLLDWGTGRHHVGHASSVIRYLVEQGDEAIFSGGQADDALERLRVEGADVRYATVQTQVAGSTLHRLLQMSGDIKQSLAHADSLEADIVHHLYLDRSEIPLYLQIRRFGTKRSWKIFANLHQLYFIHGSNEKVGFAKWLFHWLNRWILGHMLRHGIIDGLFVHTERFKQTLMGVYGDAVEKRIIVVPYPADEPATLAQEEARDLLDLPRDKPLLLFFGALRLDKGPDIFLEVLPQIDGDWLAVVAGEPEEFGESDIARCRKQLKHPEQLIARLFFITLEDVPKYFAAADAVVLPYRKIFKGVSGVLQNAAAAGKPVVVTDVGEIGPAVRENDLGIVVKPESPTALADGIREFLAKRHEKREEMRSHALEYAEVNDCRIMVRRVREAYLSPEGE